MSELTEEVIKKIREKLENQRVDLINRSNVARQDIKTSERRQGGGGDSIDESTEEQGVSTMLEFADRDKDKIAEINETLDRIETGDYGYCETCDEPIKVARLKAYPVTKLCIRCAEQEEKKEKSQKRRPGLMDDMPY